MKTVHRRQAVFFSLCAAFAPATSIARDRSLVAVAGATGRIGSEIVKSLAYKGFAVRGLTRSPDTAMHTDASSVDWVKADVRDPFDVDTALTGARYLIIAIGARAQSGANSPQFVDYLGVRTLVDAAVIHGVRHVVLVSSASSGPHIDQTNVPRFGYVRYWKTKAESHLKASGVPYTIIAPGGLRSWPANERGVRLIPRTKYTGSFVGRADVAEICVESLNNPQARNKVFAVVGDDAIQPGLWRDQLAETLFED